VAGVTVTLTVTPDTGYALKAGSLKVNDGAVELSGSGNDYSFPMPNEPVTVVAAFEAAPESYPVTIPTFEHGTITASPTSAVAGATVTLTVSAAEGYGLQADSLSVKDATNSAIAVTGAGTTYTFVMPDTAATVAAVFVELGPEVYSVSVPAVSHGTVAADHESAAAGAAITLTVTPDTGYRLQADSLQVNGGDVAVTASGEDWTFTMPAADVTVTAVFELVPVTWTAEADGASGAVTSTKITFTFNGAVEGLTANDITITDDSGIVTKEDLTMESESKWSLEINVESAGDVKVTINKAGIDDTEQSVTVHKAPSLTAEVQFGRTGASLDVTVTPGGEEDDAEINLAVTAREKNWVYFTARKKANQTITQTGDDAGKVTVHTSGTPDGETATGTWAVIGVDTRGLVFDGGTRSFVLEVTDTDGGLPRKINVSLEIGTHKTGAAVFKVTRDEQEVATLERVDLNDAACATLQAALEWVDIYCEAGAEYLIRVENDETNLPQFFLTFNKRAITLRLQGSKKDNDGNTWSRILKHGNTAIQSYNPASEEWKDSTNGFYDAASATGFFNIGTSFGVTPPKRTLIIGSNITIAGLGNEQYGNKVYSAFYVGCNATLVMEKGCLITDWYSTSNSNKRGPIYIDTFLAGDGVYAGSLRIEGGSITNCTVRNNQCLITCIGNFYKAASTEENPIVFSGNKGSDGSVNNKLNFYIVTSYSYTVIDLNTENKIDLSLDDEQGF
jgi:hypothetical protein